MSESIEKKDQSNIAKKKLPIDFNKVIEELITKITILTIQSTAVENQSPK